jgi:hypothetical protein
MPLPSEEVQWKTTEMSDTFLGHGAYRFQLRANPTFRRAFDHKRLAIFDEVKIREWFTRKFTDAGCDVQGLETTAPRKLQFQKGSGTHQGTVYSVDASGILVKRIKPDFKKLGPKCGKNMKTVAQMLTEFSQEQIAELEKNGQYTLDVAGASVVVEKGDVEILSEDIPGWLVANNGQITIALDVTITDELKEEGIAREFVNRIQNIRKSSGFEITDKIIVEIEKKAEINVAVEHFAQYIASQVLANEVKLVDSISGATELDFDDYKVNVKVVKA